MGFKDFCQNNINSEYEGKKKQGAKQEENIEDIYNKYKDKSESELMGDLFNTVNKQKKDGTFDYEGIENAISKISPYLTEEQSERLKGILKTLK